MWPEESGQFMIASAEGADFGGHRTHARNWHPNVARFFPSHMRAAVYEMLGYIYHRNVLPGSLYYFISQHGRSSQMTCESCIYNYSDHNITLERGRSFFHVG